MEPTHWAALASVFREALSVSTMTLPEAMRDAAIRRQILPEVFSEIFDRMESGVLMKSAFAKFEEAFGPTIVQLTELACGDGTGKKFLESAATYCAAKDELLRSPRREDVKLALLFELAHGFSFGTPFNVILEVAARARGYVAHREEILRLSTELVHSHTLDILKESPLFNEEIVSAAIDRGIEMRALDTTLLEAYRQVLERGWEAAG